MKNKYYNPEEIELIILPADRECIGNIIKHEIHGLLLMGGEGENNIICNPLYPQSNFYNRIYINNSSQIPGLNYVGTIVVNPYICKHYDNILKLLKKSGFKHTITSLVFGGFVKDQTNINTLSSYETVIINDSNKKEYIDDYIKVFATFFTKERENDSELLNRVEDNFNKGTNILLYDGKKPIGIISTIEFGAIASIYSFTILPEYSSLSSNNLLWKQLINTLKEKNSIKYIYLKTRNKAVEKLLIRYCKLSFLYSEYGFNA